MENSDIIKKLKLLKHPEGGYFQQTYRSTLEVQPVGGSYKRAAATHIYYFLPNGAFSRFHKNKHDEIWNLHDGEGIKLYLFDTDRGRIDEQILSRRKLNYHTVVGGGVWQAAEPISDYALMGCTVSPGYEQEDEVYLSDYPEVANRLIELRPDLERLITIKRD